MSPRRWLVTYRRLSSGRLPGGGRAAAWELGTAVVLRVISGAPGRMPLLSRAGFLGLCAVMTGATPVGTAGRADGPAEATAGPARLLGDAGPLELIERLGFGTRAAVQLRESRVGGDTLAPVPLSEDLLDRLKTFAERWEHQPKRVRDTLVWRPEYQQRFTLVVTDVKGVRFSGTFTEQVDMGRLAAAAPEVAAALKAVRLTARQWDQAMRSLYLAVFTNDVDLANQRHGAPATPSHRSVTWQNVEFLRAHPDVFDDLAAAALWVPHLKPKEVPMASDTVNQHPY